MYSQLPSILDPVPPSVTWEFDLHWWQGPTYHGQRMYKFLKVSGGISLLSYCSIFSRILVRFMMLCRLTFVAASCYSKIKRMVKYHIIHNVYILTVTSVVHMWSKCFIRVYVLWYLPPCYCGEWPLCPANLLQVVCRHRIVFFIMILGNTPLIARIFVRTVL